MSSVTRHPKFPTAEPPKGSAKSHGAARIPRPRVSGESAESGDSAASRAPVASKGRASGSEIFAYTVIFAILLVALIAVVLAEF